MSLLSRQRISHLSRNRSFLLRSSLGIMALACAIGWLVSVLTVPRGLKTMLLAADGNSEKLAEIINRERDLDATQMAVWIRKADQIMLLMLLQRLKNAPVYEPPGDEADEKEAKLEPDSPLIMLEELIGKSEKINTSERMLLLNLARGLHAEKPASTDALENLRQSAVMTPAVRFANEFFADVLLASGDDIENEALMHYRREAESFDDASYACQRSVQILIASKDQIGLQEIAENPRYRESLNNLDAHTRMGMAAILRNWVELGRAVLQFDYERSSIGRYMLTLFVGAIWIIIVGQFAGFGRQQLVLYSAALILGVMSASATLFAVVIQHDIRGFTLEGDFWHQLTYCIAGIGLREETIKLLFFAPLILFLKRRPEIESLVVAGFVGLGFALQENVGYYLGVGFSPWSRFFTANFFHLAVTGLLGLALVQFCRWPRTRWEELVATFIAVVVVHGLYDAFIMIPELSKEYSILTLLILAMIAYRFFDQAESLAHSGRNKTLSPLGVFVIGAALLGGVVMISSCWGMSFRMALISFLESGLGIFPVVFVFISRFREA